eukprot:4312622-Pleurochrysis_carterae.AAC.1
MATEAYLRADARVFEKSRAPVPPSAPMRDARRRHCHAVYALSVDLSSFGRRAAQEGATRRKGEAGRAVERPRPQP